MVLSQYCHLTCQSSRHAGHASHFAECVRIQTVSRAGFITSNGPLFASTGTHRRQELYAVPKKKPSKRRTKIRKTAWMKRYPLNWKRPMMLDMFDVMKYTDGTLTRARTTHQNWLNLPDTCLEGDHFLTTEIRPRW